MSKEARYSLFFFSWFFNLAIIWAYMPLYAKFIGFSTAQIAILSIAVALATLVAAPLTTRLISLSMAPRKAVRLFSIFAFLFFLPLTLLNSFLPFCLSWFPYLFANAALIAVVESCAVAAAEIKELSFEQSRLWGSLGFVCSIFLLGFVIDCSDESVVIDLSYLAIALTVLIAFYLSKVLPAEPTERLHSAEHSEEKHSKEKHSEEEKVSKPQPPGSLSSSGLRRTLLGLAFVNALVWSAHSAYYVYFSLYARALSWTAREISFAWSLGVLAECLVYLRFGQLRKYLKLEQIILLGASASLLRWLVCYFSSNKFLLISVQSLHAFSFCALYLASVHLAQSLVPRVYAERAQGLLSGFGIGLGSLGGRVIFGILASGLSSPERLAELFLPSSLLSAAALALALYEQKQWKKES